MTRPLLITDCDEVLLHMVVPFRQWLDEMHGIHFDFSRRFERALRHKNSGDPIERARMWQLLDGFFTTEMHRQTPIAGAVESLDRLSRHADVVILTNIGEVLGPARAEQLCNCGMTFPVIGNRGGKGPAVARLMERYRPTTCIFVDDLAMNHASVKDVAPGVWRLHMIGDPEMAGHVSGVAADAHQRIDQWPEAEEWIAARIDEVERAARTHHGA